MDPLSVSLGCVALLPPIAKASALISKFILEVRDARKEMSMIQSELVSLTSVLEILAQDMRDCPENIFPTALVEDINGIVGACDNAVKQIEQCIAAHTNDKTSKSVKWALFGRESMLRYKSILEAYQRALSMAVETLNLSINKNIKLDTTKLLVDTSELKEDTSQILQEIAKLQAKLPDTGYDGARYILQRYLDSLTDYTEGSLGQASTQAPDGSSGKLTPVEERFASVGLYPLNPSGSSTTTQSHYPSVSTSESAPSLTAQTNALSLLEQTPSPHSFAISNPSWCKGRGIPVSIPDPQHAAQSHTDIVYAMCQTSRFVISGSRDRSIRVWSMETRHLEYSPLLGHDSSVFGVVVDDTSDLLVSCGGNGSIIAWELSTGTRKGSIMQAHTQSVLSIKLNAQYLVSTSKDCTAKIWSRSALENPGERRLSEPFPHNVLRSHPAPINDVVLTDSEVITACGDRHIRVFNIDSGACLRKMSSHEKPIVSLALSADGQYIISAGGDADVVIHHKDSGHAVERLRGHEDLICAVLVIPDQNLIVSGSYDETVAIWAFNEDGIWKKERSLDTKETQRTLGLDVKERQRTLDFTENIRKAVETGAQTAALSSGRVFCMLYRDKKLLCGAGCTIVGWDFSDDAIIDVDVQRLRTASSESRKKGKGKGRQLLQHIKDRF